MDIVFESLEELYNRLKPALTIKLREFKKTGYNYIKEEDIWNYFKEVKWKTKSDLNLYEMVRDILNVKSVIIDNYLKNKLNDKDRIKYFEGGTINENV